MVDRRKFLEAMGSVGTVAATGCTNLLDGDGQQATPDDYETETGTPGTSYELDFTLNENIDLTDLTTSELDDYTEDRILEEGLTAELEYELVKYVGGESQEITAEEWNNVVDHFSLEYQGPEGEIQEIDLTEELGPELGTAYQITCNELTSGTEVTVHAKIDDETYQASATIEKELPDTIEADLRVEGTHAHELHPGEFPEYETPFQFDTVDMDREEFQQLRQQNINGEEWDQRIIDRTINFDEYKFTNSDSIEVKWEYSHGQNKWITGNFENMGPNEMRKIINDAGVAFDRYYHENEGRASSGQMNNSTATATGLVDYHINGVPRDENRYEHELEIDLEGFKVSTQGESNHGNAMYEIKNPEISLNWLNYDPDGGIVTIPSKAPNAGEEENFYPPTDFQPGKIETVTYSTKKSGGGEAMRGVAAVPNVKATNTGFGDFWLDSGLSHMANNEPLPEDKELTVQFLNYATATDENYEKGLVFGGDRETNRLMLTNEESVHQEFRENPEPMKTDKVERELLT